MYEIKKVLKNLRTFYFLFFFILYIVTPIIDNKVITNNIIYKTMLSPTAGAEIILDIFI